MNELPRQLQTIVDVEIQPAHAMQFSIRDYDGETLSVGAPLAANTNHHGTVFGGSQYSIGAVAGWALLRCKLIDANLQGSIVVKSASMEYLRPVSEDFFITVRLAEPQTLANSFQRLQEKGSANFKICGEIKQNNEIAARYDALYAIKNIAE